MRLNEWTNLFKEHSEKRIFSINDIAQLTEREKSVLWVELHRLVKSGTLERVARGWYVNPFYPPSPEEIGMVLRRPSYISMEYALSMKNILSQSSYTLTLITLKQPYTYGRGQWNFEYHQISRRLFFGYLEERGILIAEPEKALLDMIYIRHLKNKEMDEYELNSMLEDMYLEEFDTEKVERYSEEFGEKMRRMVEKFVL